MATGNIIAFPVGEAAHGRTSQNSREAKRVRSSAVTPFSFARSVLNKADQYSEGMLRRCHHLETRPDERANSPAKASREGHRSITSRKQVGSDMKPTIGQSVLKCKANLSLDDRFSLGHHVRMAESDADAQYKSEFTARVKEARQRKGWKQWEAAQALGISQDHYKQYEKRSLMPHRYIWAFCQHTRVSMEWLLTGHGKKALQPLPEIEPDIRPAPRKAPQRAAKRSVA